MSLELGLDTFGDIANGADGKPLHPATVIREVLAEGELADRLGLDFFGVGEHHRDDYAVSAPDVLLAGLATRTEHIRLGTSVTVLSSDDPIRVFQRFSTVDALSQGRAEITVGRGSFIESFPLFGLDLSDSDPDGQMARLRRGHDALDLHGRADRPLPAHRLLRDDGGEQVELLLEERLVVG